MEKIRLSPRLKLIASLVPKGAKTADVGTDHGYIPAFLAASGNYGKIIATDIKEGPLGAARETAAAAGVEREIAFLPCDGLEAVSPDDADTVIIAGMGGETIAGILARSPWTREKHLILQPMTRAGMLRKWLYANGYIISRENLVRESGEIYEVITATGGREDPPPEAELYTGKYELASQNELFDVFLDRLLARMEKAAKGLEKSGKPEDQGRLREAKIVLEGLYKMKGEKEHA